jgi:HEPN domain-containing protein
MAENAQDWLRFAEADLKAAELLQHFDDFPTAIHAFHCQQAIEKSLKAFLVARAKNFVLRQNLSYLLGLCVAVEPAFRKFEKPVAVLAPFTTQSNYPADVEKVPTVEWARHHYQYALDVVTFVANQFKTVGPS